MDEFISKHGIKIQVTVACSVIAFAVTAGVFMGTLRGDIDANAEELDKQSVQVEKVPVLEATTTIIRDDLAIIKDDLKSLLKTK